jgi:transcriptional regulator with XRE-family HTH domain
MAGVEITQQGDAKDGVSGLAARLGVAITEAGISKRELAGRLGVHVNMPSRWTNGKALPDAAHLAQLAEELDVDVEWLLVGRAPSRVPPPVEIVAPVDHAELAAVARALVDLAARLHRLLDGPQPDRRG